LRGLLFTGGSVPDMDAARHLFGDFSFVVAADSGLEAAISADLIPDLILGDMDSLSDLTLLDRFPLSRKEIWPRDKDYTDTELAMRAMHEAGVTDIVLVGGSGGRMDHLFALKSLFDKKDSPSVWIGKESVIVGVGDGFPSMDITLSGIDTDAPVSVFPLGSGPWACTGTDFVWDIAGVQWASGGFSLSNRSRTGSCAVHAVSGRFLVIFPLSTDSSITR
jgi:thiamine pyrophosphokinase